MSRLLRPTSTCLAAAALAVAAAAPGSPASAATSADTATITLNGTGATVSGTGASAAGSTVTITAAGSYRVSGTLAQGRLVVAAPETAQVTVILAGASVTSTTGAALQVTSADTVTVDLAAGTANRLAGGVSTDETADAALYSAEDLTITGSGALTVEGTGEDGIAGKDSVTVRSGTLTVTAKDDGLRGKDSLTVEGGTLQVTTTSGHGLVSSSTDAALGNVAVTGGTLTISAGNDGIHAEHAVTISGSARISIPSCYEGIEGNTVTVTGGHTELTAGDDGVNAVDRSGLNDMALSPTARITVSGGELVADGKTDGLDSNGSLLISGGTVVASSNATRGGGDGGLDANGTLSFTGGTAIGAGASAVTTTPSSAAAGQPWVFANLTTSRPAGTVVHLARDGKVVASYRALRAFTQVIFSGAGVVNGATYQVHLGGTLTGATVGGLSATGGNLTGATLVATVTAGQYSRGR